MNLDQTHRFSWDGVSFAVPADWNLAWYSDLNNVMSVRLDDDYAIRLNAEWVRTRSRMNMDKIKRRYEKMAKDLKAGAAETDQVEALPPGWAAYLYTMPDKRRLVIAFTLAGNKSVFCFFRIHLEPGGKKMPFELAGNLAASLIVYDKGLAPWECYDVSFKLPVEFKLNGASFVAGRKQMVFKWRGRLLHVVHFSLADMILKKADMTQWAADFLGKYDGTRGPAFSAEGGRIVVRRRFFPMFHSHEIGRWCFRYAAACRHDKERNMLVLSVFNYRKESDLRMLEGTDFR